MILLSPCFSPLKKKYNWGTASNYSKHGRPRAIFEGSMRICGGHLARFLKIFLALFYFGMKILEQHFLFFHMLHAVVGVDPLFAANWTLTLFYFFFFFSQNSSAWS